MNAKAICTQIVQSNGRGAVQLAILGKDEKPVITIAVSFIDSKEAAAYEMGATYDIAISKGKK